MKIYNSIPLDSILFESSKKSSYKDSARISTIRNDIQSWELVAAFFHSAPSWMKHLLSLRNKIVKCFGIKSGSLDVTEINPPFDVGQEFGGFKIYSLNSTEAVIGEDDVHLNFRISFMVDTNNGGEIVMSTVVDINNFLGTIYMLFVKPIHRVLVSVMIKKMNEIITEKNLPYYIQLKP